MLKIPIGTYIRITDYELKSVKPTISTTSHNKKTTTLSRNLQYYEGTIELTAFNRAAVRELEAFLEQLEGRHNPFYIKLPNTEPLDSISGTPTTSEAFVASTENISLKAFAGYISAGDYLTFDNHSKVYKAISTANNSEELTISPSLREDIPIGTTANVDDVWFKVRLTKDEYKMSSTDGVKHVLKVKLSFMEDL